MEAVTSYPFPSEMTVAATGSKVALAINEKGKRNIYVAEGPAFSLRKLTAYNKDDGQEITGINISPDGKWVLYVRGADHGAFDESIARNPASGTTQPKIQLFTVPFGGGEPLLIDDGDYPVISPNSKSVVFLKNDQAWTAPVDGSKKAQRLFYARGVTGSVQWSPDGSRILFVSSRGRHSLVGIFTDSLSPIQWIAPAFSRDLSPKWSTDGKRIVFIRKPARGGKPDSLTARKPDPWAIWTADVESGKATLLWESPKTLRGSSPDTHGRYNLHWAAGDRIVFSSYQDGWPHLYSMPSAGGNPVQLTKGSFMPEHITLTGDGKWLYASANTGSDKKDFERRHLIKVAVDKAGAELLTPGDGIESYPLLTGDGSSLVFFSATAQRPAVLAVKPARESKFSLPGEKLIPTDFPASQMVTPSSVKFKAEDGSPVYGQLFEPKGNQTKKPAIVFVHGGPERQMLLGWHYGDYYSNSYAINQYLVSKGFVVLSVNYRLGIGYGYEFHHPSKAYINGASEYLDIRAAGKWLASQPGVDAKRIGIYGGSYGGFLVAMALGKDSKLFAAGVDIHGEHNWTVYNPDTKGEQAPDAALSKKLIWQSSPVAWLKGWSSPVLFIHGDDDGNVSFDQSIDIVRRFQQTGKPFESLVIPDETHHWMKYSNTVKVDEAIVEFLERKLK